MEDMDISFKYAPGCGSVNYINILIIKHIFYKYINICTYNCISDTTISQNNNNNYFFIWIQYFYYMMKQKWTK